MAIKSISQLDRFDNETADNFNVGNKLAYFKGDANDGAYLTDNDKKASIANTRSGATSITDVDTQHDSSYWASLFEISQPTTYSKDASNPIEYTSKSLTYQNLIENIIWDVKAFLNARNNLSDFDFLSVITKDYSFDGNKTFNNNATIRQQLSTVSGIINNLTVNNTLLTKCDILTDTEDKIFDGWSFGLVNRSNNNDISTALSTGKAKFEPTNAGTYNGQITDGLSAAENRNGDPVCFKDGRPYELTAVNFAMSAYNLVDINGGAWNVGNGVYRSNDNKNGDDDNAQNTQQYSAVYFKDGKPYTTNVIEYAEHAYWSDLGERYLADDIYEPGTLVKFGGEKEITIADDEVNAIVSTKAFDLNAGLVGGTVIALCGRVPTKVKGKIEKFDKIMLSDIPGVACKWDGISRVIGRALESNLDENIKLVECVTRFEI